MTQPDPTEPVPVVPVPRPDSPTEQIPVIPPAPEAPPEPKGPPTQPQLVARDTDLDAQLTSLVHHSRRYIYLVLALMGVLVLLLTGTVVWLVVDTNGAASRNAAQIAQNQQASDRRWCATLRLLTSNPVSPPANAAANPSREASYLLYVDFLQLRSDFGCKL